MSKNIITKFGEFMNEAKKEVKSMKLVNDFFNKFASAIDAKYFPNVKRYHDNKDCVDVHYAIELFSNGVSEYDTMLQNISDAVKDDKNNIHEIASKFVEDFGDYKYNKNKKTDDFSKKITDSWIADKVGDYLEFTEDKYYKMSKKEFDDTIEDDYYPELVIEDVVKLLRRSLTFKEKELLVSKIYKELKSQFGGVSIKEANVAKADMTIEQLVDFFEEEGFIVHQFDQDNQKNADIEKWTDGGVDMIITLMPFSKESFIEYVDSFDVDDEIELHRQAKDYKANFTISQSLKDFSDFHKGLKKVAKKLK
jgi:hypothetical protein